MSALDDIAQAARTRYTRWDDDVWHQIVAGPAQTLSASLLAAGEADDARPVAEAYLRLAAHAVGHGYLFDAKAAGVESFFTRAFYELLPTQLADLPPTERAQALQDCWNLAENLEHSPPWLRALFLHLSRELHQLSQLRSLVERVTACIEDVPERELGADPTVHWIHLGAVHPRFLPGTLTFVSPTLLCIEDRLRTDGLERPLNVGIWLAERPILLGSLGHALPRQPPSEYTPFAGFEDPRFTAPFHVAANPWRAAASLDTSQYVVVLCPT